MCFCIYHGFDRGFLGFYDERRLILLSACTSQVPAKENGLFLDLIKLYGETKNPKVVKFSLLRWSFLS